MPRPRVIFVNRFFHPDHSATAQILSDLCAFLSARGWEVHVVTSAMLYDDPSVRLPSDEVWQGVHIHRIRTTGFGRQSLAGRAFDYASFYPAAVARLLKLARRGDIVVAKTDPPLLSVVLGPVVRLKGARLVNWLQDLYPEVGAELGLRALGGPAGRILRALRNRSLRIAHANIAIGERMAERLRADGTQPASVAVIHNWADDEGVRPLSSSDSARAEWGLATNDFVVGYSGNLGRAHEVDTVLGAAHRLRDRPQVKFVFVGGGHHSGPLADRVARDGLGNVLFRPYQPRERLAQSLGAVDVHWVSLRPELEGLIVPSKFYGVAAAGRPVIAVAAADGEVSRLVREHGCGFVIEPGDADGMAEAILTLAGDPDSSARMGERARAMLDQHFTRAQSMQSWMELLGRVGAVR